MSISGTGVLLFGGLPFDTEQTPTEAWGELGKVGFIYQVFYLLFQVHVFMER